MLTYGLCVSGMAGELLRGRKQITGSSEIFGYNLLFLDKIYTKRCCKKAKEILQDPSQPEWCNIERIPPQRKIKNSENKNKLLMKSSYSQSHIGLQLIAGMIGVTTI